MSKDRHQHEGIKALKSIGRYVLCGRTLGKGNFARVELAAHSLINNNVAIKIIDMNNIKDDYVRRNLFREAKLLRKLSHPNIIKLYETIKYSTQTHTLYCLVMELAEGGELLTHVKNNNEFKRLEESKARPYVRQLISALYYLHSKGIVHRDLKMENILLNKKKTEVKIIDFGLSNYHEPGELLSTHCGSPEYAAPELFVAGRQYGAEVDVWSLGVNMYAMLVGKLPFRSSRNHSNPRAKLLQQITVGLSSHQEADAAHLHPSCLNLIRGMLQPDPCKRLKLTAVMQHPWVTNKGTWPLYPYIQPKKNEAVEKQVIYQISRLLKVNQCDIKHAIDENKLDWISAIYHLLMRDREHQISSKVSNTSLSGEITESTSGVGTSIADEQEKAMEQMATLAIEPIIKSSSRKCNTLPRHHSAKHTSSTSTPTSNVSSPITLKDARRVKDINDIKANGPTVTPQPDETAHPKQRVNTTRDTNQTSTETTRTSDNSNSPTLRSNGSDETLDNTSSDKKQHSHKTIPTPSTSSSSSNKPTQVSIPSKSSDESQYYSIKDDPPAKNVRFNNYNEYFFKSPSPQNYDRASLNRNIENSGDWEKNPLHGASNNNTSHPSYHDELVNYHPRGYSMPSRSHRNSLGKGSRFRSVDTIDRGNHEDLLEKQYRHYYSYSDNLNDPKNNNDNNHLSRPRNRPRLLEADQSYDARRYNGRQSGIHEDRAAQIRFNYLRPVPPESYQPRNSFSRQHTNNNNYKHFPISEGDRNTNSYGRYYHSNDYIRPNSSYNEKRSSWNASVIRTPNGEWIERRNLLRQNEQSPTRQDERSCYIAPDRDAAFSQNNNIPSRPSSRADANPHPPSRAKEATLRPQDVPISRYLSLDNGLHTVGPSRRVSSFREGSMQRSRSAYYNRSVRIPFSDSPPPRHPISPNLDFRREIDTSYFDRNKIIYNEEKYKSGFGRFRKLKNKLTFQS